MGQYLTYLGFFQSSSPSEVVCRLFRSGNAWNRLLAALYLLEVLEIGIFPTRAITDVDRLVSQKH